jgi:hypothetical protein
MAHQTCGLTTHETIRRQPSRCSPTILETPILPFRLLTPSVMLSALSSALRPSLRLNKIFPRTTTSAFTKLPTRLQHTAHSFSSSVLQATRSNGTAGAKRLAYLVTGASIAGVGLGLTGLQRPVYCDVSSPPRESYSESYLLRTCSRFSSM